MSSRKPQILKGFRDYLPDQMVVRNEVIRRFRDVFERHGFAPLDTPAIEYLEVLTGKAGENEKLGDDDDIRRSLTEVWKHYKQNY